MPLSVNSLAALPSLPSIGNAAPQPPPAPVPSLSAALAATERVAPALCDDMDVSAHSLTFLDVLPGIEYKLRFTVKNLLHHAQRLRTVGQPPSSPFSVAAVSGTAIAPGMTLSVEVRFSVPRSRPPARTPLQLHALAEAATDAAGAAAAAAAAEEDAANAADAEVIPVYTGSLVIRSEAGGEVTVALRAVSPSPRLLLGPPDTNLVAFGTVSVGTVATRLIDVSNVSTSCGASVLVTLAVPPHSRLPMTVRPPRLLLTAAKPASSDGQPLRPSVSKVRLTLDARELPLGSYRALLTLDCGPSGGGVKRVIDVTAEIIKQAVSIVFPDRHGPVGLRAATAAGTHEGSAELTWGQQHDDASGDTVGVPTSFLRMGSFLPGQQQVVVAQVVNNGPVAASFSLATGKFARALLRESAGLAPATLKRPLPLVARASSNAFAGTRMGSSTGTSLEEEGEEAPEPGSEAAIAAEVAEFDFRVVPSQGTLPPYGSVPITITYTATDRRPAPAFAARLDELAEEAGRVASGLPPRRGSTPLQRGGSAAPQSNAAAIPGLALHPLQTLGSPGGDSVLGGSIVIEEEGTEEGLIGQPPTRTRSAGRVGSSLMSGNNSSQKASSSSLSSSLPVGHKEPAPLLRPFPSVAGPAPPPPANAAPPSAEMVSSLLTLSVPDLGTTLAVSLTARLIRPAVRVSTSHLDFGTMVFGSSRREATFEVISETELLPVAWRVGKSTGFRVSPSSGILAPQGRASLAVTLVPTHLGPTHAILPLTFSATRLPAGESNAFGPAPDSQLLSLAALPSTLLALPIALTALVIARPEETTPDGVIDIGSPPLRPVTGSDFRRTGELSARTATASLEQRAPPVLQLGEGGHLPVGALSATAVGASIVGRGAALVAAAQDPVGIITERLLATAVNPSKQGPGSSLSLTLPKNISLRSALARSVALGPSAHPLGHNTVATISALASSTAALHRPGVSSSTALLGVAASQGLCLSDFPGDDPRYTFSVARIHARAVHAATYNAAIAASHAARVRTKVESALLRRGALSSWDDPKNLGMADGRLTLPPPRLRAPDASREPLWLVRSISANGKPVLRPDVAAAAFGRTIKTKFKSAPTTNAERFACSAALSATELSNIVCGPSTLLFGSLSVLCERMRSWCVVNGHSAPILVELQLPPDVPQLSRTTPLEQVVPPGAVASFDLVFFAAADEDGSFEAPVTYVINGIHAARLAITAQPEALCVSVSTSSLALCFAEDDLSGSVSQEVQLRNESDGPASYTWVSSADEGELTLHHHHHDVIPFDVEPSSGTIPPRSSESVTFVYRPTFRAALAAHFRLDVVGGTRASAPNAVSVSVSGEAMDARLGSETRMVDFGKFGVGLHRKVYVPLQNTGTTPCVFRVLETSIPPFVSVSPMSARIEPGESMDIACVLTPTEPCVLDPNYAALTIAVRGGKDLILPLAAVVIMPHVIATGALDFGAVVVGTTATRRMTLSNRSDIHTEIVVDFTPYHPQWAIRPPRPTGEDDAVSVGDQSIFRFDADDGEGTAPPMPGSKLPGAAAAVAAEDNEDGADGGEEDDDAELAEGEDEGVVRSLPPRFIVRLNPNATLMFDLVFRPRDAIEHEGNEGVGPATFSFRIPVSLVTAAHLPMPGLQRGVTGHGIAPRLKVATPLIDFGSRAWYAEVARRLPYELPLTLFNTDAEGNAISWCADTSNLSQYFPVSGGGGSVHATTFALVPDRGVIASGGVQEVKVRFNPFTAGRTFVNTIPIHLTDNGALPPSGTPSYLELELSGRGILPQLSFDRRELILPPVPLGAIARGIFWVFNTGFDFLELEFRIPANEITMGVGVPLSLSFPQGRLLSAAAPRLPVEVSFLAPTTQGMAFTVVVEFFDKLGTVWAMPVTGSADNCLLSTSSYLEAHANDNLFLACEGGGSEAPLMLVGDTPDTRRFVGGNKVNVLATAADELLSLKPRESSVVRKTGAAPSAAVKAALQLTAGEKSAHKSKQTTLSPLFFQLPDSISASSDLYTAVGSAALPVDILDTPIHNDTWGVQKRTAQQSKSALLAGAATMLTSARAHYAGVVRWLNTCGAVSTPIISWPEEVVAVHGKPVFDYIELASGRLITGRLRGNALSRLPASRRARAQALFKQAVDVVTHLKSLGAHVHALRPEALLSIEDFLLVRKYISKGVVFSTVAYGAPMLELTGGVRAKRAMELRLTTAYPLVSLHAWSTLVLQSIKLFALARVTLRHMTLSQGLPIEPENAALSSALISAESIYAGKVASQRSMLAATRASAARSRVSSANIRIDNGGDSSSIHTGRSTARSTLPPVPDDPESSEAIVKERKLGTLAGNFEASMSVSFPAVTEVRSITTSRDVSGIPPPIDASTKSVDGVLIAQATILRTKAIDFFSPDAALRGSNLYSPPEATLLRWLGWHSNRVFLGSTLPTAIAMRGPSIAQNHMLPRRLLDFERDLFDGTVFIHTILSHAPELGKPGRALDAGLGRVHLGPGTLSLAQVRDNCGAIIEALLSLGLEPPFGATDLCPAAFSPCVTVPSLGEKTASISSSVDDPFSQLNAAIVAAQELSASHSAASIRHAHTDAKSGGAGAWSRTGPLAVGDLTSEVLLDSKTTVKPVSPLFNDTHGFVLGLSPTTGRLLMNPSTDADTRGNVPVRRNLLLASLWLFTSLPPQIPRALVDFKGPLGIACVKAIVLTNPTKRAVTYTVTLEQEGPGGVLPSAPAGMPLLPHVDHAHHRHHGLSHEPLPPPLVWTLPATTVRVAPESSMRFPITAIPQFSQTVHAKLCFRAKRGGALAPSVLTYALRTVVTLRPPLVVSTVTGCTYSATNLELEVAAPRDPRSDGMTPDAELPTTTFLISLVPLAPGAARGGSISHASIGALLAANPTTRAATRGKPNDASSPAHNEQLPPLVSLGAAALASVSEYFLTGWVPQEALLYGSEGESGKEQPSTSALRLPSYLLPGFNLARRTATHERAAAAALAAEEARVIAAKLEATAANGGFDPDPPEDPLLALVTASGTLPPRKVGKELPEAVIVDKDFSALAPALPSGELTPEQAAAVGRLVGPSGVALPPPSLWCRYTSVQLRPGHGKRLPIQFLPLSPGVHRVAVVLVDPSSCVAEIVYEIDALAELPAPVTPRLSVRVPIAKEIDRCLCLPPVNAAEENARDLFLGRLGSKPAMVIHLQRRDAERKAEAAARVAALHKLRSNIRTTKTAVATPGSTAATYIANARLEAVLQLGTIYDVTVDSPFFSAPKKVFVPAPLSALPASGAGLGAGSSDDIAMFSSSVGGDASAVLSPAFAATLIEATLEELPGPLGTAPNASSLSAMAPSQAAVYRGPAAPVFFKPLTNATDIALALSKGTPAAMRALGRLPIKCMPQGPGVYTARVTLSCVGRDTRTYDVAFNCHDMGGTAKAVYFNAPLGRSVTQVLPVANLPPPPSAHAAPHVEWALTPRLTSANASPLHFSVVPNLLRVPPGTIGRLSVTWTPAYEGDEVAALSLVPSAAHMARGTLEWVPPFDVDLHGTGEPALANGKLELRARMRSSATATVQLFNVQPHAAGELSTWRVSSDVEGVDIPPFVTVPRGTAPIDVTFTWSPSAVGTTTGALTFTDTHSGRMQWWALSATGEASEPVGRIELTTAVRGAVVAEVTVSNPSPTEGLELEVTLSGEGLVGAPTLSLPPGATRTYELLYAPLFPTRGWETGRPVQGLLSFCPLAAAPEGDAASAGEPLRGAELEYLLDLLARPAPSAPVPPVSAPVGETAVTHVTLDNPTPTPALVRATILPCEGTPQGVFVVHAAGAVAVGGVGAAETGDVTVTEHRPHAGGGALTIAPFSGLRVPIAYTPSALGAANTQRACVLFESPLLGEWRFDVSGVGSPPAAAAPLRLHAVRGSMTTASIHVRNPFGHSITVRVALKEAPPEGVPHGHRMPPQLSLLLDARSEPVFNIAPSTYIAVPISFTPSAIEAVHGEVVVSVNSGDAPLTFIYPIIAIGEAPLPKDASPVVIRGTARTTASLSILLPLPGLGGSSLPFAVSIVPIVPAADEVSAILRLNMLKQWDVRPTLPLSVGSPARSTIVQGLGSTASPETIASRGGTAILRTGGNADSIVGGDAEEVQDASPFAAALRVLSGDIARAVTLQVTRPPGSSDALPCSVQLHAMRPLRAAVELIVRRADGRGGQWRLPARIDIAPPPPDDELVVEAPALDVPGSVSFSLANAFPSYTPFVAAFTLESSSAFTVSPSHGTLPPSTAAAVSRGTGLPSDTATAFSVRFTPREYGVRYKGRLTIDTPTMQWNFDVQGTLAPLAVPQPISTIDDHLGPRSSRLLKAAGSALRSSARK